MLHKTQNNVNIHLQLQSGVENKKKQNNNTSLHEPSQFQKKKRNLP